MIKPCTCKHKYQDEKYGEGNRVHNPAKSKADKTKTDWVCTICKERK